MFKAASKNRYVFVTAILVAVMAVMSACSTKKNTAASRRYQAFITRYNVFYNGDTHFKETLKEMEQNYEDDYSQKLFLHPAEAYVHPKSPQPAGSFDRSIEKAQKAIQLHSIKKRPARKAGRNTTPEYKEWLKRGEYNPFLHNAWLLMAKSQYYKGDYAGAAATFYYISKNFKWLPEVTLEARLWQALCYCALDWLYEAENIIVSVKEDQLVSSRLRQIYNFTYADYLIRSREYGRAAPYLEKAAAAASGAQKTRLYFLLGQILTADGQKKSAYDAFAKAARSGSASYRTKFNARILQSEVYEGDNIEPEVKALKRMTRYDRNKEYLDQIYRAIGNLYLSRRDTAEAIANYRLAVDKSTRNGIDKAMAQVTLGNLYFKQGRYDLAQPCLSEAVPQLPEDFPDFKLLKQRSDVLDELAVYSQNVVLQDSLLKLSLLSPDEQLKVAERLVAELKKKEKEEAEAIAREEYLANQQAAGTGLNSNNNAPTTFTLNNDDSWYFYNTSVRNAGKTEFQKRWGSRRLEDDWRRRNKATFNLDEPAAGDDVDDVDDSDTGDDTNTEKTDSVDTRHADDPHFPEYYLKQIPKNDVERTTANDIIQEGLYNMGVILKDKLDDFQSSRTEFDRLLTRYPDNVYRLDTYYNLYLLNMRDNKPVEAEKWRQLIVSEFPDSKQGQAMANPQYLEQLKKMETVQNRLYEQAYEDYLDNRNSSVHEAYEQMNREYPLSPLMPRFMFLHALAYVTENNSEQFNKTLREMLEKYPDTDMTPLASAYVKGLSSGRKLHSGAVNNRAMLWDTRLTNDSTLLNAAAEGELQFESNPDSPQILVLLFSTDSVAPNQLLYDVARHNFNTFTVRDFDLEVMNFGRLGMLIVKGFANLGELEHYRRLLAADNGFMLPQGVRPVMISQANFDTLLRSGRSFDDYFKAMGEDLIEDVHEQTLPAEEYPPAAEMYSNPPVPDVNVVPSVDQKADEASDKPRPSDDTPPSPVHPSPSQGVPPPKQEPPPAQDIPSGSEGDDPLLDF